MWLGAVGHESDRWKYSTYRFTSAKKQRLEVSIIEIVADVLRDDSFVGFDEVQIFVARLGRQLERDVQQLPHVGVKFRMALDMANGIGET